MTLLRHFQFAPGIGVVYAPDKIVEEDDEESKVNIYISIKGWISFYARQKGFNLLILNSSEKSI